MNTGGGGRRLPHRDRRRFARHVRRPSDPFSDFFKTFFGGVGAERRRTRGAAAAEHARAAPGRDVEQELELTLEDAFHGVTRRLAIKHDGHARTVDVRIPAGVSDGSRVRVSGEGEQGGGGGAAGDLYLRIRLQPHPHLHAQGAGPAREDRGAGDHGGARRRSDVPTITGKPLRLRVPPTTQNGQVFRLKGHGMPLGGKTQERGDLFADSGHRAAEEQLTPEQREHFEALAKLQGSARQEALEAEATRLAGSALVLPAWAGEQHEPQQIHREGPGSRRRRAAAGRDARARRKSSRSTC